ncbi:MAG: hypothetical protein NT004_18460 [Bacteroidetes bacterium]|nr:hypothetical protein [Bacteroidota bacterium]
MFKTPNSTHIVRIVLIVVVLIAIVEVLVPGVVSIVLGGTPVFATSKTAVSCPAQACIYIPGEIPG